MIVEVRSYRIKPGRRDEFIRFFETRSIPALRAHGMTGVQSLSCARYATFLAFFGAGGR